MKSFSFLLAGALGMASATDVALAQTSKPGIERRYIIDCGTSVGPISHAGPGADVGKRLDVVGNCYLIRHVRGHMLRDTGVSDDLASTPDGRPGQGGQRQAVASILRVGLPDEASIRAAE